MTFWKIKIIEYLEIIKVLYAMGKEKVLRYPQIVS